MTKAVPVCAVSCLAANRIFAGSPGIAKSVFEQEGHKFDKEIPGLKMMYRRMAAIRNRNFIRFARFLQEEIGQERVIELIKKQTEQRLNAQAKRDLKRLGKSDFNPKIKLIRDKTLMQGHDCCNHKYIWTG